ncbi:MAG: DNA/RNA non-specific endonuclease [Clostridia bacterium]|nr:DNA/RNA non-specific endonuclease [Clostridia bacterium]
MKIKLKKKNTLTIIIVAVLILIGAIASTSSEDTEETTKPAFGSFEEGTAEISEENTTEKSFLSGILNNKEDNTEKKPESSKNTTNKTNKPASTVDKISSSSLPVYKNSPYVVVNNNEPAFTSSQKSGKKSFETYANLDSLGRCGVAYACIGKDIMPTGERGEIGQVKPTGWKTAKYDFVDGRYLYNRCHLIGWQLTGENANNRNLITGTRYMNVQGMLPFENMVDDYIEETRNHVLYKVTPVFKGNELVARGVQIEAYSVEDDGDGICFNVYCFNVQPGVRIDYKTGESALDGKETTTKKPVTTKKPTTTRVVTTKPVTQKPSLPSSAVGNTSYIVNTNSLKFHLPSCSSADDISAENRWETKDSRDSLISKGYSPCGRCKP